MDKKALRQQFKTKRVGLSSVDRKEFSRLICERLAHLTDWSQVDYLHVYEPISSLGEVDISPFVDQIRRQNPNIGIYTSRKIAEKWRITSIGGESLDQLPAFDYIIVPMLGFDHDLHRIGYGGGYYDRFLATQPHSNKIGVCFDALQVDKLPIQATDIALDKIITEATIYSG